MITPLFSINQNSSSFLPAEGGEDLALLIAKGEYNRIKKFLKRFYSEIPQYVAFMEEDEMQKFYKDIKHEYVKYPYSFGVKKI